MVCAFFFSSRLVLFWGVFDVFWGLPWVLLGFNRVFWWLGVIHFLLGVFLTCFEVSVGFCWVLVGQYVK